MLEGYHANSIPFADIPDPHSEIREDIHRQTGRQRELDKFKGRQRMGPKTYTLVASNSVRFVLKKLDLVVGPNVGSLIPPCVPLTGAVLNDP